MAKDKAWGEFKEACVKSLELDGMNSVYVPPAIICDKLEYCLVAMEPGAASKELEQDIEKGYSAFNDWHINYCAYHFLCGGKHNYHITDIYKGAIKKENKKRYKDKRIEIYKNWLPLLKKELELLGNPKAKIIVIGKTLYKTLYKGELSNDVKKLGLNICENNWVYHPSKQYPFYRNKEYDYIIEKLPKYNPKISECEFTDFIKSLMKKKSKLSKRNWSQEIIDARENGKIKFSTEYVQNKKFTVYKWNFEKFKELGKIQHSPEASR